MIYNSSRGKNLKTLPDILHSADKYECLLVHNQFPRGKTYWAASGSCHGLPNGCLFFLDRVL